MAQISSLSERGLVVPASQSAEDLLADWRWLVGRAKQPLLVTACGDMFVQERGNQEVYFLDAQGGTLSKVASTTLEFERLLTDQAFVDVHFSPEAVADMLASGTKLSASQVYSLRQPLVLGGRFNKANIEVADVSVHFSLLGQIHEQVRNLPPGTPIKQLQVR